MNQATLGLKEPATDRIHTIKGRYANSYLIEEQGRFLVIDVHLNGEKYVLGYLRQVLQLPPDVIDLVICTHDHVDHIGGLRALARECRAKIGIPLASNAPLQKLMHAPTGHLHLQRTSFQELFRRRMWKMYLLPRQDSPKPISHAGTPSKLSDRRVRPDYRLHNGQSLPGFPDWEVIHTPGHTWDSCCYYHRSSASLVTGDTLLGSQRRNQLVLPSIYANSTQLQNSVSQLSMLEPKHIYPGHGKCFSGHGILTF